MSETAAPNRRDFEAKIVARAWADEGFRARLKADPRAAVAEETGVTFRNRSRSRCSRRRPKRPISSSPRTGWPSPTRISTSPADTNKSQAPSAWTGAAAILRG